MKTAAFLVIGFYLFQIVESSGKLKFKLATFNNPKHRLADGSCCDQSMVSSCSDQCDNYFKICLTRPTSSRCSLGNTKTEKLGQDSISFGNNARYTYNFPKWEGSFAVAIETWDKDGSIFTRNDDLVARFDENVVIPASWNEAASTAKTVQLRTTYSTLDIEVRIYCDRNYLIPSCEEYCTFKNDTSGHYRCDYAHGRKVCLEGWYGNNCLKKKRHCKPRDDELGHYKCHQITGEIVCLDGWRNETSKCTKEINECNSNPCLSDGNCTDLINGFNCTCKEGYSGKMCEVEIDECQSNPCSNGRCIDKMNSFECLCDKGYSGTTCSQNIDECISNPCQNQGICVDLIAAYSCTCINGFTGAHCETTIKIGSTTSNIVLSSTRIVPVTSTSIKTSRSLVIKRSSSTEILRISSTIWLQPSTIRLSQKYNDPATTSSTPWGVSFGSSVESVTHSYEIMRKISMKETVCISSSFKDDRINTSQIVPASSKMSHSSTKEASSKTATSSTVSGKIISNKSLSSNSHGITTNSIVSGSSFPKLRSLSISQSTSLSGLSNSITVTPNGESEEVYFEIVIKGDVKKWDGKTVEIVTKEICNSIIVFCARFEIGCSESNNSKNIMLSIVEKHKTSLTAQIQFTFKSKYDKDKKAECLQDAILKSSKNIKARTSFAIVKANYINSMKANKSVLLTSHYAGSSMSSFVVFDMTKKNEAHSSEKDPSKMVATLVAVSIFVISALLVVVTWKRKNNSIKRIQPLSQDRRHHGNTCFQNYALELHDAKLTLPDAKKETEKKVITSHGQQSKNIVYGETLFKESKEALSQEKKTDQTLLLDSEVNHLETLFI